MLTVAPLLAVISGALIFFWIVELVAGFESDALVENLGRALRADDSHRLRHRLEHVHLQPITRPEVWVCMWPIWLNVRTLALGSNSLFGNIFALLFFAVWTVVGLKMLTRPNPADLRILLGAELFLICVIGKPDE